MADIIDNAEKASEVFQNEALTRKHSSAPNPTGHCFNCGESIPFPSRWCDEDCLTDWEKRRRAKANGPIEE